ncbi:malectin domain-containing carbohydrate-binding protein [Euzebyella saccharophila]|uniref:Malectin domain-containing carbohydrate-binding protein n=1 Tax=Euzebyella saccharophila TaxID=679664 RepID=A0ABV8JLS5_9FLAO|nr:malectin domain-containing carbohydrate-binding protein [Euzebyella saccharophila]
MKTKLLNVLFLFIFFFGLRAQQPETNNYEVRINSGGNETTYFGKKFSNDFAFDAGSTLNRPQAGLPEPYSSFRFSRSQQMTYNVPVPNGQYTVNLHFSELWFGATGGGEGGAGKRVFDVSLEGQLAEDNLDIFAEVGAETMLVKTYAITVTDGTLNIHFDSRDQVGGERHPVINAIEVLGEQTQDQELNLQPISNKIDDVNDVVNDQVIVSGGDPTQNYTYSISGQPDGITIDSSGNLTGTITELALAGGENKNGIHDVTVTVSQQGVGSKSQSFIWTITQASCEWTEMADSHIERFEGVSQKIGDKLYVLGGFKRGIKVVPETEIYNVPNDSWQIGASMPLPVTHTAAVATGDEIWLIGGFAGDNPGVATNVVQIYNVLTDSWRMGPELPRDMGSGATALLGDKIYHFGGLLPDRQTVVGDHLVLDLKNEEAGWSSLAPMPEPRNHHSGIALNGLIYAIGGQVGHDGPRYDTKFVHAYNPTTDQWTRLADLARPRSHFKAATTWHNGKILISGGVQNGVVIPDISEYDAATNSWSEICKLPGNGLEEAAVQAFDNELIVAGGRPITHSNTIIDQTLSLPLATNSMLPPTANAGDDLQWELTTDSLMLNGAGNDPDGGFVVYQWSQVSGPNQAVLDNPRDGQLLVSNLAEGNYVFRLTVMDDENDMNFDIVAVDVVPPIQDMAIEGFAYYRSSGSAPNLVGGLYDGDKLYQFQDGAFFAGFEAVVSNNVKSIRYELEGPLGTKTISRNLDNSEPIWNEGADFGIHKITATPFSEINEGGLEGNSLTINYEIVNHCDAISIETYSASSCDAADGYAILLDAAGNNSRYASNLDEIWVYDDEHDYFIARNLTHGIYEISCEDRTNNADSIKTFEIGTQNPCSKPNDFAFRINTGGTSATYNGEAFEADNYFDTGSTLYRPQTGLPDPYRSFRYSRSQQMSYNIPLDDGEYTVNLYFAELWFGATDGGPGGVGSRIFDVNIEGILSEDNLDIFAEVGADAILKKSYTVTVTDGELNIDFDSRDQVGGERHPVINAIEILGQVIEPEERPFVTTWKTDNFGISEDNQITITTYSGETYNYYVDWGDGSTSENVTGDITHTYKAPGIYTVSINGDFPRIDLNVFPADKYVETDGLKLLTVEQWGDIEWSSMQNAFFDCASLDVVATDVPDLSRVTSMNGMFGDCDNLIGTPAFSDWNVSNVIDMSYMFFSADAFNQDIGRWDVSSVSDMTRMFWVARSFNQNIEGWNVSNVTDMSAMFFFAGSFNQDIGDWDISNVANMEVMFENSGLSNENYDNILIGWSQLASLQNGVTLDAPKNQYCDAEEARQHLIDAYGWEINDAGKTEDCDNTQDFALRINTGGTSTTYNNETFADDQYYDTGRTLDRPQTGLPEPYQTFRFSRSQQMGYTIPVPDGEYTVKLHFAELWFGATGGGTGGTGLRVFDVSLESNLVENDLDIYAEVGAEAMLVKTHTVTVTDGELNIDFDSRDEVGGQRHPVINGIEIIRGSLNGLSTIAESSELKQTNLTASVNEMLLYPNQASVSTNISFDKPTILTAIYLFDMSGRLLQSYAPKEVKNEDSYGIEVSQYSKGQYLLKVIDKKGTSYSRTLIIQR